MEEQITPTTSKKPQISTPQAIIIAGALIMVGILMTKGPAQVQVPKTLSEQVGISKDTLNACITSSDLDGLNTRIQSSVNSAMANIPQEQRGTPYSVIVGKNGVKTDIKGADSYENFKVIIDAVKTGKKVTAYAGNVPAVDPATDHIYGNKDADVMIIEYSDFECPYCKQLHPNLKKIVDESQGAVAWTYRNYPLHQHSFEKLVAAECVAKLKGNDAYWKYTDLLFSLLKTSNDSVSEQL